MPIVSCRLERERELELGADAVGPRDEHRLPVALRQLDQRAEAADPGEHFGAHRALRERLDPLDQRVARVDVDAGIAVGQGRRRGGGGIGHRRARGGRPGARSRYGRVGQAALRADWAKRRRRGKVRRPTILPDSQRRPRPGANAQLTDQLVFDLAATEPPSFSNFLPGRNAEAVASLEALAAGSGAETGVLLWGAPGVGKTHLLRAVARAAAARGASAAYIADPGMLLAQDAESLATRAIVAVDGIDLATSDAQAVAFRLFNALKERGGHLLAASRVSPPALPLREDLRTRLGWGLVYEILPLDDAEKAAASGGLRGAVAAFGSATTSSAICSPTAGATCGRFSKRFRRSTGIRSPPSARSPCRWCATGCSAKSVSAADGRTAGALDGRRACPGRGIPRLCLRLNGLSAASRTICGKPVNQPLPRRVNGAIRGHDVKNATAGHRIIRKRGKTPANHGQPYK